MAAAKFDLTDEYGRIISGDERERVSSKNKIATIGKVLTCIDMTCCCCPCSSFYASSTKAKNRI
jgi:hypothetical protein